MKAASRTTRLVSAIVVAGFALTAWLLWSNHHALILDVRSEFSHIRIRARKSVRSLMFVRENGREVIESRMDLDAPHELLLPYSRAMFASYLYQPRPKRVLIVGLGAGSMVRFLQHHDPDVHVDVVEIDPVVVRLADEYFGTRSTDRVHIHTLDGLDYIEHTDQRYHVIYMDAFLEPSGPGTSGTPQELRTLAFYRSMQSKLEDDGLVVFNLTIQSDTEDDIETIRAAFAQTDVYRTVRRNLVVVGRTDATPLPDEVLSERARGLDRRFDTRFSFESILKSRRK